MLEPQQLMTMFFIFVMFLVLVFPLLYLLSNWQEIRVTMKANCLIWRHPDNTADAISKLELVKLGDAPGGTWPYSSFFFLPLKQIKWCWEVKKVVKTGKNKGKVSFKVEPFIPDSYIDYSGVTTGQLADALDWRAAKRLLEPKAPLLQKVAQGGVIIMGLASIFGIMALLDMLGKGG